MNNFINTFSKQNGSFEFIFNNKTEFNKILFYFKENNPKYILNYINNYIRLNNNIKKIFNLYGEYINHIGYDKKNSKYKFYIGLYNFSFKDSLNIINNCKNILGIEEKYYLEKDFIKFDCIGFDINNNWVNMKIYELINKENNFNGLIKNIKKEDVKEIGYLKTFTGRKKKFFRFNKYQNLDLFIKEFDLSKKNKFGVTVNEKNILKNKVKYYCIEGDKKEIYFI